MSNLRMSWWINQGTTKRFIEVGNRDCAIRISGYYWEDNPVIGHWVKEAERICAAPDDLVLLYEYLKESGRVIHLTSDIAYQTIQYLKETN